MSDNIQIENSFDSEHDSDTISSPYRKRNKTNSSKNANSSNNDSENTKEIKEKNNKIKTSDNNPINNLYEMSKLKSITKPPLIKSSKVEPINLDYIQPNVHLISFGDANISFNNNLSKNNMSKSNISNSKMNNININNRENNYFKLDIEFLIKENRKWAKSKYGSLSNLSNILANNKDKSDYISKTYKKNQSQSLLFKFRGMDDEDDLNVKDFILDKNDSPKKHPSGGKQKFMSFNQPEPEPEDHKKDLNSENVSPGLFVTTEGIEEQKEEQKVNDNSQDKKVEINPFNEVINDNKNKFVHNNDYVEKSKIVRIAEVTAGMALLVTEDDTLFYIPTFLLPTGAKIGEYFDIKISAVDNYFYQKNKAKELNEIQKKYAG